MTFKKARTLQAGDIVISRTESGTAYQADLIQEIDDDTIRRATVQRWWPNDPTREQHRGDPIVRYIGSEATVEVVPVDARNVSLT